MFLPCVDCDQFLTLWQIKDQYVRAVSELNQQNTQLQDELKRSRNDLKVANIQVDDLRKVLEELRNELLLKVTNYFLFVTELLLLLLLRKFIERRIAGRPQVHYVSSGTVQMFKCQYSS